MIKKFTFKKFSITTLLLLLALILYNYPEEINEIPEVKNTNKINIYLIDENDFVSMTKIETETSNIDEQIKEIIKSLTIGETNTNIPKSFKPIIPKNTKLLDFSLEKSLLKINFSKELLSVTKDDEEKMLEAIIYSLTSLKDIKKIMIFIEGERLTNLPNSNKKLDLYLDRNYGINKIIDITNIQDTNMVTIYYLNKKEEYYYIPISYISNNNNNKIEIIINNLKSNKLNSSNLSSHLDYQVELMNYETTEGEVILNFNEILLNSLYSGELKEEIKYAISYSIYDTLGISNITFTVNSEVIDKFRLEN